MNEIENCTLEGYSFGDGLRDKYKVTPINQISSESACSDRCENDKNCTFSSWKGSDQSCTLLNGLEPGQWEKSNPPFFCSRNGSTITEKEDLCKPVSKVVHESQGKYKHMLLIRSFRLVMFTNSNLPNLQDLLNLPDI